MEEKVFESGEEKQMSIYWHLLVSEQSKSIIGLERRRNIVMDWKCNKKLPAEIFAGLFKVEVV